MKKNIYKITQPEIMKLSNVNETVSNMAEKTA